MQSTEHEDLINSLEGVSKHASEQVQCFRLPFRGDLSRQFIIAWIYLKPDAINQVNIKNILATTLTNLQQSSSLQAYEGIEVVIAQRDEDGGTKKILRVDAYCPHLIEVISLLENDVTTFVEGKLECLLYREIPEDNKGNHS